MPFGKHFQITADLRQAAGAVFRSGKIGIDGGGGRFGNFAVGKGVHVQILHAYAGPGKLRKILRNNVSKFRRNLAGYFHPCIVHNTTLIIIIS